MSDYFDFRRFRVYHDLCAMKVGTDGVLLGAWCRCAGAHRVLDVGTGSGLIALMIAQRSGQAQIDAVDIDPNAVRQCELNSLASPWAPRIRTIHADVREWQPILPYDLIVCNPPYFVDSLKAPDAQRTMARHSDTLQIGSLLCFAQQYMTADGLLALVLPADSGQHVANIAHQYGLRLCRQTEVYTTQRAQKPKRMLLELKHIEAVEHYEALEADRLTIGSEQYRALTEDFYL